MNIYNFKISLMVINKTISAINLQAWQRLIYATDLIFFQRESQFLLGARSQFLCSDLPHKLSRSNWVMMDIFPRAPNISKCLSKCPLASLHLFSKWWLIPYHATLQLPVLHSVSLGIYSLSEHHLLKHEKATKSKSSDFQKSFFKELLLGPWKIIADAEFCKALAQVCSGHSSSTPSLLSVRLK